jgi:double-stranded uracil-DNA glycosylase
MRALRIIALHDVHDVFAEPLCVVGEFPQHCFKPERLPSVVSPMLKPTVDGFAALSDARATHLILGSMPGVDSLEAGQYYAHPQNTFWPIMAGLIGEVAGAPYERRVAALLAARVALWDVLRSCVREGSLDASIRRDSELANDFAAFFAEHPQVTQVFFNGAAAEASFKRHSAALLREPRLRFARLPSTSPAHAALRFEQKRLAWQAIVA